MTDNQPSYHYTVGTEVSAKYRGAFCEAMIKTVKKNVIFNVRVSNMKKAKCYGLTDEQIRGTRVVGATVKALFPGQIEWRDGVITGVKDKSIYTVEFNDGDVRSLPRRYLCLQGVRHFPESDSLDHLPLTDPENFGTPVLSGKQRKTKRKRLSFDSDSDDVTPTNYCSSKRKNSTENEYDEEEEEEIEVKMKSDTKDWLNDKMLGKLVLAQTDDNIKKFIAVVVNPTIHEDHTDMDSLFYLVRSFVTGKFHVVSRTSTTLVTPGHLPPHLNDNLKEEVDEAFRWQGNGEIPSSWRSEDEVISPNNAVTLGDADEMANTNQEENSKKIKNQLFLDVLYKFMEDCETPIIKTPVLGYKDLDLYQLYLEVKKRGGWSNINKTSQWVEIYESMGIPMHSSTGRQRVRRAYEKYLLRFERYLQTFPVCPITTAAATMRKHNIKRRVSPPRATTSSSAAARLLEGERRADGDYRQGDVVLTRCEQFDGNLYEAKIVRVGDGDDDVNRFLIHYCGWNKRHDEWIDRNKIVRHTTTTMTSPSDGGCHNEQHHHHHRSSSCETDNEYHHRGIDGSTSRFHPRHHASMHRARSEEKPPTSSMPQRHQQQPTSSKPVTTTTTSSGADDVLITSSFVLGDKMEKFVAKVSATTSVVVTSSGDDMTSYDAITGLLVNHDDDDEIARICSRKNDPAISTKPTMTSYHETKIVDVTAHDDDYKVYNEEELVMERDFLLNIQLPHDHDVNELEGNIEDEVRFESAQIVIDQLAASNMLDESGGSFASMATSTDDVNTRDSGFRPIAINNMTSSSDDNCDNIETIGCKNGQQKDDVIMTQLKGADENWRPATAPPATTTVKSEEMGKKEATMIEEDKMSNKRPKRCRKMKKKERMPELPPPITDEDLEHLTNEQRIDLLEKRQQVLRKIWSKYRSSIQRLDRERRKFVRKKTDGSCSGN